MCDDILRLFDDETTYNIGQVADRLKVSRTALSNWDKAGRLKAGRDLCNHRVYRGYELNRFLEDRGKVDQLRRKVAYIRCKNYEEMRKIPDKTDIIEGLEYAKNVVLEAMVDADQANYSGEPEAFYSMLQGIIHKDIGLIILFDEESLSGLISYRALKILCERFRVDIIRLDKTLSKQEYENIMAWKREHDLQSEKK